MSGICLGKRRGRRFKSNEFTGRICLYRRCCCSGKYLRGTPISIKETKDIVRKLPLGIPAILGGWAIRGWRQQGWTPLRKNLFLALQDTDATLDNFLKTAKWKHCRRTPEQWSNWAKLGASSKAVKFHPDLWSKDNPGPLTYEVKFTKAV